MTAEKNWLTVIEEGRKGGDADQGAQGCLQSWQQKVTRGQDRLRAWLCPATATHSSWWVVPWPARRARPTPEHTHKEHILETTPSTLSRGQGQPDTAGVIAPGFAERPSCKSVGQFLTSVILPTEKSVSGQTLEDSQSCKYKAL